MKGLLGGETGMEIPHMSASTNKKCWSDCGDNWCEACPAASQQYPGTFACEDKKSRHTMLQASRV